MTVTTRGRYALRVLCDIAAHSGTPCGQADGLNAACCAAAEACTGSASADSAAAEGCAKTGYVSLKDISERQDISRKYLESIMSSLCKAGLTESSKGKSGGYRLTRPADRISLGEVLRVTEGDLAPVSCMEEGAAPCGRAADCPTLPVWEKLSALINDYLDSVTLADL